ncbi:O-antigen ligase family protein [Lichenibacterium dinghuense]|uniref:O-antigen ligase family protein n=1 Tax=Lichenibacterium dinghuense TaxID=2895977 RepID=UPI001F17A3A2|nr:O-antigen ligase family protein [Lichenibacterium sp. 6Y81]
MRTEALRPPLARPRPAAGWRLDYGRLVNWSFALFVFCGSVAIVEPSPYDFASLVAIPIWFVGGFRVHRTFLPLFALIFLYNLGGFIGLIPYVVEHDPTLFMLQSLYLALTTLVFALFFAEDTERRAEIVLRFYAASTVFAALAGIVGYFNVAGLGDLLSRYGRASGTFKDPNVLGSYLVMGAVYYVQAIVLGRTRHVVATGLALLVVVAGILLSFSRGSWGAFVVATVLSIGLTFLTSAEARLRRRILLVTFAAAAVAALVILLLLALPNTRDFFLQRAALEQDYDEGVTGRFGNQIRSIPMLLGLPNGFGPLRFRLIFGLEPHNSYINAFASYGWLGGFAFLALVGLTVYVGFRVAWVPSPYRRAAQVYWPSLLVFLLQGFQIDIDHWRHVFLMLGAVWGIETARVRWLERGGDAGPVSRRAPPLRP